MAFINSKNGRPNDKRLVGVVLIAINSAGLLSHHFLSNRNILMLSNNGSFVIHSELLLLLLVNFL